MTIDERYGKGNEQQHHFPHPSDHALLREAGKWKPLLVLKSFLRTELRDAEHDLACDSTSTVT